MKKLSERAVELHNGVAMAQRTNDTHAALQVQFPHEFIIFNFRIKAREFFTITVFWRVGQRFRDDYDRLPRPN